MNQAARRRVERDVGKGTTGGEARGSADARAPTPASEQRSGPLTLDLAPHLASIGRGRRWVAAEAVRHGITDTRVRVVQLLASELISNAILHGPPGGEVCVRIERSVDAFRVEVDDRSTSAPRLVPITRDGGGGRGLALVERLADHWGHERREPRGNTVWFEVRVGRQVAGAPSSGAGTTSDRPS